MDPKKTIRILYQILFFTVPLVLSPATSELFEFNKMVTVYILTTLILFVWILRSISEKQVHLFKTYLFIPLMFFLFTQIISTLISLDTRSSLFGYYGRFNGGLISILCYIILFFGFVSNLSRWDIPNILKTIFASTLLASLYGILEHFGIDKNIWIQDVQNRVFSTFGQPNWLAAWLAAVIPVSLSLSLSSNPEVIKHKKNEMSSNISYYVFCIKYYASKNIWLVYLLLSQIFFITLLFTKSRSGILGFGVANAIFWGFLFLNVIIFKKVKSLDTGRIGIGKLLRSFIICNLSFGILVLLIGSPWTPSIVDLQNTQVTNSKPTNTGPALELGGSSSVEIRKIVWQGAIDVWKHYPLFGSGLETFAFSYYQFRPVSHNLVSEWDFLYNKAHNEYLNFMATTGTIGIVSYILLILFTVSHDLKFIFYETISPDKKNPQPDHKKTEILIVAFLAGYISILVTNFFGFSVVPVNLLFFLYPAMIVTMSKDNIREDSSENPIEINKWNVSQKTGGFVLSSLTVLLLYAIFRYWYADILYNKADLLAKNGNLIDSVKTINLAIDLSPKEAIYHDELASQLTDIAVIYHSQNNTEGAKKFSDSAIRTIDEALKLSPNNLNILRNKARIFIKLSDITPSHILEAKKSLLKAIEIAPTEAKLYYNLSLIYYRMNDTENTLKVLEKTIALKSNYKDARYAYAIILSENGRIQEAKEELTYILEKIDPLDTTARKALEELDTPAK